MAFVTGPMIPPPRRGTRWSGLAASADWYFTIPLGIAGGTVPKETGFRPPDALDLWSSILDGSAGPRMEVVHQVENEFSCDTTQSGGGCCSSMRMGEMKLIVGGPGDSRTLQLPERCVPSKQGQPVPCSSLHGFVRGCEVCATCPSNEPRCMPGCTACFGNRTEAITIVTETAAACQAACVKDDLCGAVSLFLFGS